MFDSEDTIKLAPVPYCRFQRCVFQRLVSAIRSLPCTHLQLSPPVNIPAFWNWNKSSKCLVIRRNVRY